MIQLMLQLETDFREPTYIPRQVEVEGNDSAMLQLETDFREPTYLPRQVEVEGNDSA